jgi:hypothetical protein
MNNLPRKPAVMLPPHRSNARQEYKLKQRQRFEGAPLMAKEFPRLKGLKVTLSYYDSAGNTKNGEMKCQMNVEHARAMLCFACPAVDCLGGDFDLSAALASAVAARRKTIVGEMHCEGKRGRGGAERVPCRTLLRYTLSLEYE